MKKYLFILVLPILLSAQLSVKKLEYIDAYGRDVTSYSAWKSSIVPEAFRIGEVYHTAYDNYRDELIDIVVYAPLYDDILDSLNIYISDLEAEGYTIQVDTIRGWTAEELRTHLAGLLSSDLVGAVLIGNVPFAWYEMSSGDGREEFPIELYLMDLDGTWIDSDGDGLFDDHTGNKSPEIWVGRIYASSMTWGNEVYLVNNYFSKLHRYRTGGYTIPQKALAYVDDDWYGFNDCSLGSLYDTVVVVRDYNTTTAVDFRARFSDPYEWVQVCSHSSPWGNTFKYTGGYSGTVFNFEYWFMDPPFLFMNLFQCSGTRFFEENYCGGCYIFGPDNGLLTIGSAKVGSMLHFSDFYGPLNTGISIGEAFKQWFAQWGITDPSWFYGMCICGDPVLKPKQSSNQLAKYRRRLYNFDTRYEWSSPEPVDTDYETDGYVATVTDGAGRIWASWVTGRSSTNGRTEICVAYNQGTGWSSPEIIDPYIYWDFFPAMTCDTAGRAVLSWSRCYGRNYDVFLTSYDGSTWGAPYRVSSRATDAMHPAMTVDGDARLWVTMERWNHLNGDIYCRYNEGGAWQPMFAVTIDSANDYKPAMATDSTGRAWTAWASERYGDNRNIYVKNYNPASGHWENLRRITSNPAQDQDVSLCVDGSGTVWVAWTTWRHGNSDIYESHYDGSTWTPPRPVSTDSSSDEACALVVDRDGYVWCIWQSDRTGDWEIVANYYKDGQWQELSNISNDPDIDILPAATLDDSGYIWVLFQSSRDGDWNIYASQLFSDLIEPQVTVVSPNGGEVWNIGEFDTIRWTASDNSQIDSISLYYSTNNGTDWNLIASGEPNDSEYIWQVPATPSNECLVRIVAYDPFPNTGEDVSDGVFTINDAVPPEVAVYAPNGGEVFHPAEVDTIRWSATDNIGVDSVTLEFSSDSGGTWSVVAAPSPQDSVYEWVIPGVHSTECLIRVRAYDASANMGEDISDSLFSIIDNLPPEVTVAVPNGGEIWYWDEVHTITWSSVDNVGIDSLDIELSLDGGNTYPLLITHITGNDSVYDWTIPETTSYECLIRITVYDVAGLSTFDESDSLFTIGELGVEELIGIPQVFDFILLNSNPYSGQLRMRLQVPEPMSVKVAVYDVEGRFVEDVVNGRLAPGYHTISWNDDDIPSGIYFLFIKTEEIEKTEKIIKLK
ncbi:MAG TPA: T9SS type A sorting domain-containing protein [candidate division WOR-3 bacterium]|uniref:T9SS type A sorting domain-containing protein n=1 Tax=candidate division WOR-3 bacterium TaxID=2052148 RepID=A0A9C9EKE5_UNCW3|nr:T9SS type A sorting domain-containing protein [candidate division WOR-3 bacterium]